MNHVIFSESFDVSHFSVVKVVIDPLVVDDFA